MNYKFRKKLLEIEAFQLTEERRKDDLLWPLWLGAAWNLERTEPGAVYPTQGGSCAGTLSINTLEGQHLVKFWSWIIRGIKGELYPCYDEVFKLTYEEIL